MTNENKYQCVPFGQNRTVSRRDALAAGLAATGLASAGLASATSTSAQAVSPTPTESLKDDRKASPKRYRAKKSINLWAFPYPDRMSLRECMQLAKDAGFDGIELNYDLENDLSPRASVKDLVGIRKMADEI
jgi:hexulose-6-phosphate isomerase